MFVKHLFARCSLRTVYIQAPLVDAHPIPPPLLLTPLPRAAQTVYVLIAFKTKPTQRHAPNKSAKKNIKEAATDPTNRKSVNKGEFKKQKGKKKTVKKLTYNLHKVR